MLFQMAPLVFVQIEHQYILFTIIETGYVKNRKSSETAKKKYLMNDSWR